MHNIGFLLSPDYYLLDLAGPLGAFDVANKLASRPLYNFCILSVDGGLVPGSGGAEIKSIPYREAELDTLLVIGGDIALTKATAEIEAIKEIAARTPRIASVCTGAFLLAKAGILDGRRATTHWRAAPKLQKCFPSIKVEADRIFVADGNVWSSAGITAGIDLALAFIDADHGLELARAAARELVVHHRRTGGQSQFSELAHLDPESDRIRSILTFVRNHLPEPLPIERLADAANLSVRQFGRAFRRETGETPARAVERLRVEAARARLREGVEPVEKIALSVGFSDPERMRRAFVKLLGVPPQAVRRTERQLSGRLLPRHDDEARPPVGRPA